MAPVGADIIRPHGKTAFLDRGVIRPYKIAGGNLEDCNKIGNRRHPCWMPPVSMGKEEREKKKERERRQFYQDSFIERQVVERGQTRCRERQIKPNKKEPEE